MISIHFDIDEGLIFRAARVSVCVYPFYLTRLPDHRVHTFPEGLKIEKLFAFICHGLEECLINTR